MPRGRKKTIGTAETQAAPVAANEAITPPANEIPPQQSEVTLVTPPIAEQAIPVISETESAAPGTSAPAAAEAGQRERFRSWVTDTARGYSRMSDDQFRRIIIRFDQKPAPDILSAVKGAGFQFQPDYLGHKNAWVRRDDHTGRLQVEAIEKLIRAQTPGLESPER